MLVFAIFALSYGMLWNLMLKPIRWADECQPKLQPIPIERNDR